MSSGGFRPELSLRTRWGLSAPPDATSLPSTRRRTVIDPGRVRRALAACPEIDCLRDHLPPGILAAAELRAAEIGTGADHVLISNGIVAEDDYIFAIAAHLGLACDTIERLPRAICPLGDEELIAAAAAGLLPLDLNGSRILVVAPKGLAARRLITHLRPGSELAGRILLTTPESLRAYVMRHAASAIERRAAEALRTTRPDLSAGAGHRRTVLLTVMTIALLLGASLTSGLLANLLDIALALVFLGWTSLRLVGILAGEPPKGHTPTTGDGRLPVYTIIVALYREAAAVAGLVAALDNLAYPALRIKCTKGFRHPQVVQSFP